MFYRNDKNVVVDIIDQLNKKMNKINKVIDVLRKSIKKFVNCFLFLNLKFGSNKIIVLLSEI